MGTCKFVTYVMPEEHPGVQALRNRYQTYMEWIAELKEEATKQQDVREPDWPASTATSSSYAGDDRRQRPGQAQRATHAICVRIVRHNLDKREAHQVAPVIRAKRAYTKPGQAK